MHPYKPGIREHLPLLRPFLEVVAGLFLITIGVALLDTTQDAVLTTVVVLIALGVAVSYSWRCGWHVGVKMYTARYITVRLPKVSKAQWGMQSFTIYLFCFAGSVSASYLLGNSNAANVLCVLTMILGNVGLALYVGGRAGWQAADNNGGWI
jgi:hypothetical protein